MGKINVSGVLEYILWNGSVIKIIQLCYGRKRDVEHRGSENARGVGKVLSLPSISSLPFCVHTHTQFTHKTEKQMSYDLSYIWNLKQQKNKLTDKENRLVVARG